MVKMMKRFLTPLGAAAAAFTPSLALAHHEGITGAEPVAGLAVALVIGVALVFYAKR